MRVSGMGRCVCVWVGVCEWVGVWVWLLWTIEYKHCVKNAFQFPHFYYISSHGLQSTILIMSTINLVLTRTFSSFLHIRTIFCYDHNYPNPLFRDIQRSFCKHLLKS